MVVGDKVFRVAESAISGKEVNRREVTVTKITKSGYLYTSFNMGKFKQGAGGVWYEHVPRGRIFRQYRVRLEPKV